MKKGILGVLLLLAILAGPTLALAAGQVTTGSHVAYAIDDKFQRCVVTISFTADDATAAFASYTLNPTAMTKVHSTLGIKGWYLYKVETDPGTTGPTNGAWDLDITNANGFLESKNLIDDRSSTATQQVIFSTGFPVIENTWTVSIADNAVNSATVTVYLTFVAN